MRTIGYSLGRQDEKGRPIEEKADFLSASYAKPNGRQMLREAVYHSFRLDLKDGQVGKWDSLPRLGPEIPEA